MTVPWPIEEPATNVGDTNPTRRLDKCESDKPSEYSNHETDTQQSTEEGSDQDEFPQPQIY